MSVGKPTGLGYPVTSAYLEALRAWLAAKPERNESALAREVGCTPAAINQLMSGKRPASTLLPKISAITGVRLSFPGLPDELQQYMSDFAVLHASQPEEARKLASLARSLQKPPTPKPDDD